ncbi:Hypothetical_protein [Hexamita inflata]|uniref:Hypothetical_protein n=1 Tax=Hexamita inflata TaxID=28002 RepID=A0AA86PJQ0_9EUKA|nr:Hypothetical protein HINF_LOCUS26078 [Hexamita inflata]
MSYIQKVFSRAYGFIFYSQIISFGQNQLKMSQRDKSMSSHYQIADFLQVLDPQSPDTFQEFREKCMSTGLLMNNQYLKGGALELYKQRNTRIMVERAIVIGTKLGNKFDNYIHYLEHVWQDNPMIMDFLQQVALLVRVRCGTKLKFNKMIFSFIYYIGFMVQIVIPYVQHEENCIFENPLAFHFIKIFQHYFIQI